MKANVTIPDNLEFYNLSSDRDIFALPAGELPRSITGTSDIAIIDKSFLVSMRVVGGLKVVFELKKNVIRPSINQAIVETILANALSAYAVLVVLTDLKNDWHFFWLQEFKIAEIVVHDIHEAITIIECAVAAEVPRL